jgi:hypothetical protein
MTFTKCSLLSIFLTGEEELAAAAAAREAAIAAGLLDPNQIGKCGLLSFFFFNVSHIYKFLF